MSDENPLEDLYVEEAEINKERLSNALLGKIGIDRDSGNPVILSGYSELSQRHKVFAYLLYRRAAFELGHIDEDELGVSSSRLSDETGVPEGTIRSYSSDTSLFESDESKSGYIIPDFAISEAIEEVEDD